MKYIMQVGIISGICCIGELLYMILPLPIPASVYGMIILFCLLTGKIIKLEQVKDVADYLLLIMPIFFISPTVGIITAMPYIKGNVIIVISIMILSTMITGVVTGIVAQWLIRSKNKRKKRVEHE